VSVQFALGAPRLDGPAEAGLVSRPFARREVPAATIVLGQLRERALPVAPALFAESLVASLSGLGAVSRT
jgi:hypothetical protein